MGQKRKICLEKGFWKYHRREKNAGDYSHQPPFRKQSFLTLSYSTGAAAFVSGGLITLR
jgi:hypothetical protein